MLCPEWASSYKGCVNTVTGCVAPPVSPSRVFNQQWRCGCCYTSQPLEQDFYSDILPPRLLLHTLDPKYWNMVQLLVQEDLFHLAYQFIYRLHCLLLVQPRSLWLTKPKEKSPNISFIPAVGTKWMGQQKKKLSNASKFRVVCQKSAHPSELLQWLFFSPSLADRWSSFRSGRRSFFLEPDADVEDSKSKVCHKVTF